MTTTQDEMVLILRQQMDAQKVLDPSMRAAIGAIAMGESGFSMKPELGYAHTSNERIRKIFGSRVASFDDNQLDELKANPEQFFDTVYGGAWGAKNLGNTERGDGFRFRGRGMFQLTGRSNYERYGKLIGVDITTDPEVADQPQVAAAIAVAYMKDRYHGGGWEGMKHAVGNNISDIDQEKDDLYQQYFADGTFDPLPGGLTPPPQQPPGPEPQSEQPLRTGSERRKDIQRILQEGGLYKGAIDGNFGPLSRSAFNQLLSTTP